jgi:hypothetical protein
MPRSAAKLGPAPMSSRMRHGGHVVVVVGQLDSGPLTGPVRPLTQSRAAASSAQSRFGSDRYTPEDRL